MLAVSYFGVPGKCRLPGVAVPLNMLGTTSTGHALFPLQYYMLQHSKKNREIEHFFHCVQNFCSMYTQLLFCLTARSRTPSQPSNLCQVIPVSHVFFFSVAPQCNTVKSDLLPVTAIGSSEVTTSLGNVKHNEK